MVVFIRHVPEAEQHSDGSVEKVARRGPGGHSGTVQGIDRRGGRQ